SRWWCIVRVGIDLQPGAALSGKLCLKLLYLTWVKPSTNSNEMNTKPKSFKELIAGNQPILVDFFATWCGPCKMMQPILEDAAKQLGDKVKIIKVDVDKNPAAANSYQVKGVPTLILFRNGKILWRQSGVVSTSQLLQVIHQAIAKA